MIYRYNEIKTVHLEITERCNASCPMCARNIKFLCDSNFLLYYANKIINN